MKKIVSAALVASLVAGAAFAEVTVAQNIRVRPEILKVESPKDGDSKMTFADLDGYGAASDSLSVKGSTDYAGVAVDLTLTSGITKNGSTPSDGLKTEKIKTDGTSTLQIDNYYGWLNWGAFKLTAGVFDSRYTNRGNYTATEEGILDKEFAKALGLNQNDGGFLKDFGNVSQVNAGNYLSFIADYTFADVGGGKLLVKGGLVENAGDDAAKNANISTVPYDKRSDGTFSQSAGYFAEAAWEKKDLIRADFIFKNPANKFFGFGLYLTPLMIPNAKNVVVGFTYGLNSGADDGEWANGLAIDLRATYNITKEAVVALGAKFERAEAAKGEDAESALQIAAEFSYAVNDWFTGALDFGYFNKDLDDNLGTDAGDSSIVASLRGKFTAGKNAAITAALRLNKVLDDGDLADTKTTLTFDIPVVFRIKM